LILFYDACAVIYPRRDNLGIIVLAGPDYQNKSGNPKAAAN
jgi:hypothetical protein